MTDGTSGVGRRGLLTAAGVGGPLAAGADHAELAALKA